MSRADTLTKLIEGATKGPWRNDNGYRVYGPKEDHVMCEDYEPLLFETKHTDARDGDAAFICYLANNAPAIRDLIVAAEGAAMHRDDRSVAELAKALTNIKEQE